MKTICFLLLLLGSSAGLGQVLEVNIWNPMAGKAPLTFEYGREARTIHERLGASVTLAADLEGRMHYAVSFDNWTAWAKFVSQLEQDEAWSAFLDKVNADPSAELEDHYLVNVVSAVAPGPVYDVFIWEPELGRNADLVERATRAEAIHEKAGADVGISIDQLGRLHYLMAFDTWEAWAKFRDTPNEAFQKFMAEQNQDPTGRLVKVYSVESL